MEIFHIHIDTIRQTVAVSLEEFLVFVRTVHRMRRARYIVLVKLVVQLLLVQASSDSTSVLVSWQEGSRGYSRTRPEVQCLVGSLRERGSESGLDSLLPQLLHGHGQRVDSGKVGVQTSWHIEDDILC